MGQMASAQRGKGQRALPRVPSTGRTWLGFSIFFYCNMGGIDP
jgi:hypothetical protein